ncbi:MAG: DEAD/DEAH box helicase family protein [Parcubacteria group bacterium]
MQLKEYQQKTLDRIQQYLKLLDVWRAKAKAHPDLIDDFPARAWKEANIGRPYRSRKNGLGQPLPTFALKIPTGGGKTLLAVKAIDLINTTYRKKRTGLVLWVVPTNQIFAQTIKKLRDREDPYRQHLDIASGGRTLIVKKEDGFTPQDVRENLVVLMLMLPSANRQLKETLRMFRDNGAYTEFFPTEDDRAGHEKLLKRIPNLDVFSAETGFWGRQVKTSLGNTLRLLQPLIVLDEGHKAYGTLAQNTLLGFNPLMIVELSATPPEQSNKLVDVRGRELDNEEMIKLDLHLINKTSPDWHDTLLASIDKRNALEKAAKLYRESTGVYIRPMALIQVERTGKEQRGGNHIHSEDVREYLIKTAGIPAEQIAVVSAELKELKDEDAREGGLQSPESPVRYIITKQALQEGWDNPFAYVLTILTNPSSKTALTQLVGRILRQPYARKTGVEALDESYVFTFRPNAKALIDEITKGFEAEGLGDLAAHIAADVGETSSGSHRKRNVAMRSKFKKAAQRIVLPVFAIKDGAGWRPIDYAMDILSRVPWDAVEIKKTKALKLTKVDGSGTEIEYELADEADKLLQQKTVAKINDGGLEINDAFVARHLLEVVPNPWIAHELGRKVVAALLKHNSKSMVAQNLVFIIESLRTELSYQRDLLAQAEFKKMLKAETFRFLVISKELGFTFSDKVQVERDNVRTLTQKNNQPLQRSLFDFIPEDEFNTVERDVAWYLEDQEKLLFWFRNAAKRDYAIQGWQKGKIYPDFVFTEEGDKRELVKKVFVVETKGLHLKNEDTAYKQSMFDLCNQYAKPIALNALGLKLRLPKMQFEVVYQDEWQAKLNELLQHE